MNDSTSPPQDTPGLDLTLAAGIQDSLMTACNDLDRLQVLLQDACDNLLHGFHDAMDKLDLLANAATSAESAEMANTARLALTRAVVALQFQDMSSQLVHHTQRRMRACADQLANEAFGDDEEGGTVLEAMPNRPNPVTQDEMDAGSIELF